MADAALAVGQGVAGMLNLYAVRTDAVEADPVERGIAHLDQPIAEFVCRGDQVEGQPEMVPGIAEIQITTLTGRAELLGLPQNLFDLQTARASAKGSTPGWR